MESSQSPLILADKTRKNDRLAINQLEFNHELSGDQNTWPRREMDTKQRKHKQLHPWFELRSPIPYPMILTIMPSKSH